MNFIRKLNYGHTNKKVVFWDTETNGKCNDKKRIYDQIAFKSFDYGNNLGNAFFESNPPPFSLITPGAFNARGLDMNFFAPETRASKPNNLEMTKKVICYFQNSNNCNFLGQNSSFDQKALVDTAFENCLADVYIHNWNQNVHTDLQSFTKAVALLKDVNLYDKEKEIHSTAQEFIASVFLSEKKHTNFSYFSRHDARYDVTELDLIFRNYLEELKELWEYMNEFYCENKKDRILDNPIHMECDWHYTRGAKPRAIMLFKHHPVFGEKWMSKILIDPDYITSTPPENVPELIKKNMKPQSFKRASLSFVWPIGSKEFENLIPNVSRDDVQKIHTILENDDEFKKLLVVAFKGSKQRKYQDVYQYKYDFGIHQKDKENSKFFHAAHPTQKMKFAERFRDQRLVKNAKRLILHYYPDQMDQKTKKLVLTEEIEELFDENSSRVTFKDCQKDFEELQKKKLPPEKMQRLEEYYKYLKKLEDEPERMLGE